MLQYPSAAGTASGRCRDRRGGLVGSQVRERERGRKELSSFAMVDMDVHPCEAVILGCHPEFFPKGVRAPLFTLSGGVRSGSRVSVPTCLTCACSVISGSEAVAISNEMHTSTLFEFSFVLDHDSANQMSHVDI